MCKIHSSSNMFARVVPLATCAVAFRVEIKDHTEPCPSGQEACFPYSCPPGGEAQCFDPSTQECISAGYCRKTVCQIGEITCNRECHQEGTGVCCGSDMGTQTWYANEENKQCCRGRGNGAGYESWTCSADSERCVGIRDDDYDQSNPQACASVAASLQQTVCSESLLHAGWDCYGDVTWAQSTGIHQHPEWYHGLTASSSMEEFHLYVSQLPRCSAGQPAPCAVHQCAPPCYQSRTCSVSLSYNTCGFYGPTHYEYYEESGWEATLDVCTPDGNGGANIVSASPGGDGPCPRASGVVSVAHFPNLLCTGEADHGYSAFMDGQCLSGACNQDGSRCDIESKAQASPTGCNHVAPDSDCANQLRWAMTEGIHHHPEWYTGLAADSSFLDFQRYISALPKCSDNGSIPPCYGASDPCPLPCP